MDIFAQRLKKKFYEEKSKKVTIKKIYDKNEMKNILQSNCVKTANEIIKIVIKELDNYANNKETSVELSFEEIININYTSKLQTKIIFRKKDSKMLKDIFTDKIPMEIMYQILEDNREPLCKYASSNYIHAFNLFRQLYLDDILKEQFDVFNIKYVGNNSITNIIEHKYFQLTILCY